MASILQQLRDIRREQKLSQAELGEKLGLPQSHISNIEKGNTDPRLSTVSDFARLLDHELVLVPRQLLPQVQSLIRGEEKPKRRWQADEDES